MASINCLESFLKQERLATPNTSTDKTFKNRGYNKMTTFAPHRHDQTQSRVISIKKHPSSRARMYLQSSYFSNKIGQSKFHSRSKFCEIRPLQNAHTLHENQFKKRCTFHPASFTVVSPSFYRVKPAN